MGIRSLVCGVAAFSVFVLPAAVWAAAAFVSGEVPDWDQPYNYVGFPIGPGPDPSGGSDPFDAWCAPTSASNLLGHWEDARGILVADGTPFSAGPAGQIPWPAPPSWHDWNLGEPRPTPGSSAAPMGGDLGWFMDTNHSGSTLRGNASAHIGTYTKDIHAGLAELIVQAAAAMPGVGTWSTGTRGTSFAFGTDASGAPATAHASAASAFAEIRAEIDANRTIIVSWTHWNIAPHGSSLPTVPFATDDSQFGADYYDFLGGPTPPDPWGNEEVWSEGGPPDLWLGHTTTAVGYIAAGDPDDINAPQNPTDWVIVHDNVPGTARNVIVPLGAAQYGANWIANTNANRIVTGVAVVAPSARLLIVGLLLVLGAGALLWRRGGWATGRTTGS